MATVITCNICDRELTEHCPHGRCGWMKCTNRNCEAAVYDVHRGILVRRSGTVERL